ncbi:MAG TPA: hypothetical protein VMP67_08520 [Candidatus Limnocylindria bacterium]|nr:hypothetical protein [Candidatus Limnocylindria bacterium]
MSVGRAATTPSLALLVLLAVAACTAAPPADPAATAIPPMATPSAAVGAAAALVEQQLAEAGLDLLQSPLDYRPGEPGIVQAAPRAVYRASLAQPNEGWVVIYDLGSADAAQAAGDAFAAYLGSGVGQTNYPRDAQFALSRVGQALVFSWWSRERTGDAARAEAVFEAIRRVGQPIDVRR